MKKIILFIIFALPLFAFAQSPRVFTAKCNIAQSGTGSGYWQVAVTSLNDPGGLDATEIHPNDKLLFNDGGIQYTLNITTVISAVGASATIRVSNVGVTGISSIPTTAAVITRGTRNFKLPPIAANISGNNQQLQNEYFSYLVDSLLNTVGGDNVSSFPSKFKANPTDAFVTKQDSALSMLKLTAQIRDSIKIDTSFTDASITSATIGRLAYARQNVTLSATLTSSASSDKLITLPSTKKACKIYVSDNSASYDYVIVGPVSDGVYTFEKYRLSDKEFVTISVVNNTYKIETSKTNSFLDISTPFDYKDLPSDYSLYQGGLAGYNSGKSDSLFVLKRKLSYSMKPNLCKLSRLFDSTSTDWWFTSGSFSWSKERVSIASPLSSYSFKLTLNQSQTNTLTNSYTFALPKVDSLFGDRFYNFSFYAYIPNSTSTNVALTVKPQGVIDNAYKTVVNLDATSVGEWKRYSGITRMDRDTAINRTFWVAVSGDSADYILIQDFQLTEGSDIQPYQARDTAKYTSQDVNIVYSGIGDGKIYVDKVANNYGFNANKVLQAAFNFARQQPKSPFFLRSNNQFQTVFIQKDKTITTTIYRTEGINLESNYWSGNEFADLSNHAIIYADLQDSTKYLFEYTDELSDNVKSGAMTSNIAVKALSRGKAAFKDQMLVDAIYQDCYFSMGNYFDHAIHQVSGAISNLYNTIRRVDVDGCRDYAFRLQGTPTNMYDCKIYNGGGGIYSTGQLWVNGLSAEDLSGRLVKFSSNSGSLTLTNSQCELITTPFIEVDKCVSVNIQGGLIGTVRSGSTYPYSIKLDTVSTGTISSIYMHGGTNRISTTSQTGPITINNVISNNPGYKWPGPQSFETFAGIADSSKVISFGNTAVGSTDKPSFWEPFLFYSTGFPDTPQLQAQLQIFRNELDTAGNDLPLSGGTMSGNIIMGSNKIIGGSSTTSDLYLQSTSGVGTTGADVHVLVGNNGATEAMTVLNNGSVGIQNIAPSKPFHVNGEARIEDIVFGEQATSSALQIDYVSGNSLIRNATSTGSLRLSGDDTSTGRITLYGRNHASGSGVEILGGSQANDITPRALAITAPSAWSSATTNMTGANVVINGGAKATAGGTNGNVILADSRGGVGVGTASPSTSAIFDVVSTTKGSRPIPQGTFAQRAAISSPSNGLWFYLTNTNKPSWYNGSAWRVPVDSTTAEATYFKKQGTTTNDDASAGGVGEYTSSLVASGSAVSLITATAANVTSISLTAGDWDVEGWVNYDYGTATVTQSTAGINTISATIPTDGSEAYSATQLTLTSSLGTISLTRKRISIASTTTVYLVGRATFSAGTTSAFGGINARRVR